jgi:hypothetical protein
MNKIYLMSFISFLYLTAQATDSTELSYGTAKNSKGKTVYLEKHTSEFSDGVLKSLVTNYFLPGGDKFGFIKSDFSRSSYIPNYNFEDKRHSRSAGVIWEISKSGKKNKTISKIKAKASKNYIFAYAKESRDTQRQQKKFEIDNNTVTGQGLHNFLRMHITEFKNNTKLKKEIKFLIPMNQDQYNFRIRAMNYDKAKKIIKLRIEADSWLFRIVAPQIDVTYDTENYRLIKYEGPSNLLEIK